MAEHEELSRWLGTWFGCGRSPVAPGTVGTLGALPLYLLLSRLSPPLYWSSVAMVAAAGYWASGKMAEQLGDDDPSCVVIDEVAGSLVALGLVRGRGWRSALLTLVLFRALDVAKPPPVSSAERARPAGLGIMADDVVAGALAGLVSRLLTRRRS
jgi:phosphatidylglycerophosphatase A